MITNSIRLVLRGNLLFSLDFSHPRCLMTSSQLFRSYECWSKKVVECGFTPEEVLELDNGNSYIVIDPNDHTLLLALHPQDYVSLLKVVISNEGHLTVLLTPSDARYPTRKPETTDKQNSPLSALNSSMWTQFLPVVQVTLLG